jgi:hypothetical protein
VGVVCLELKLVPRDCFQNMVSFCHDSFYFRLGVQYHFIPDNTD